MNHLRLRIKLGLIVGILVLCVLAVALLGYRELGNVNRRVQHMVDTTSKKVFLTVSIRTDLQKAQADGIPRGHHLGRQGIPGLR